MEDKIVMLLTPAYNLRVNYSNFDKLTYMVSFKDAENKKAAKNLNGFKLQKNLNYCIVDKNTGLIIVNGPVKKKVIEAYNRKWTQDFYELIRNEDEHYKECLIQYEKYKINND